MGNHVLVFGTDTARLSRPGPHIGTASTDGGGMGTTAVVNGAILGARGLLLVLGMLLVWSVAPAAAGMRGDVVMSGSMAPAVRAGDVLLTRHRPAADIRDGELALVENPARPGTTLVHRVIGRTPQGALLTKGDANATADTSPVPASMVIGVPRLRVPYIALPAVWWAMRDVTALTLAAAALAVLTLVAAGRGTAPAGNRPGTGAPGRHRTPAGTRRRGRTGSLTETSPGHSAQRPIARRSVGRRRSKREGWRHDTR
jgi:signal peptidase